MYSRTLPIIALTSLMVLSAGCGPTKAGMDARSAARDRMDAFNASFTHDQAKQEYEVGQFDRALRNIELAIRQAPDVAEFYVLKGRIHLETHRLQQAINAFATALEKDPQSAEAHYFSGIVYQRWSDDEQSYECYARAYEIEPDNVQYLLADAEAMVALGELDPAEELVYSRLDYFENNSALRHLLGQIALLQGEPKKAAKLYSEARMLDPDNELLIEELAWAQYDAGMFGQCFETVVLLEEKSDEERTDLIHLRARCLAMLERTADAHRLYMELTRRNPTEASIWIEFGTIAWELGDYRRLAHCSVRTIALAPDRYEGYMLKGLYERHEDRLPEAVELLKKAGEFAHDAPMPHLLLGRALEESGDEEGAVIAYAEALRIDPYNADARALHSMIENKLRVAAAEE